MGNGRLRGTSGSPADPFGVSCCALPTLDTLDMYEYHEKIHPVL